MPNEGKGKRNSGRDVTVSKALSYLLRHAAEREGLRMNAQGYANVEDVLSWRKIKSLKVTLPEIKNAVGNSDKKRFALLHIPSAESGPQKTKATTIPPARTSSERPEGKEGETRSIIGAGANMAPTATNTEQGQEDATGKALLVNDTDPSHYLVRATQGHSIKSVDASSFLERLYLENPSTLPETVVHGTYHSAWPSILSSGGLRCMGRNHVHFATGPSLESILSKIKDGKTKPSVDGKLKIELEGSDGRVISGIRRDSQVLVYINLRKALEAGCPFWRSENGVILSEGIPNGDGVKGKEEDDDENATSRVVPVDFFDVVVEKREGLGVLWEHGKEVQTLPPSLTSQRNPKGKGKGKARGKS